MKIVIDIPEKAYNALTHSEFDANLVVDEMRKAIANGIPLPEHHGRYKSIVLQEHDAEPRRLKAILDTATDEIYVCKLTRQGAELLGMTIEIRDGENE
jgi:hypothetical protein